MNFQPNPRKLETFLGDSDLPLEFIFDEINSLYEKPGENKRKLIDENRKEIFIGKSTGNKNLDMKIAAIKATREGFRIPSDFVVATEGCYSENENTLISAALEIEKNIQALAEDNVNAEDEENNESNDKDKNKKKKLTPEQEKKLRARQIAIAKRLAQESEQIEADSRNPQRLQEIARDPRAYAAQHPTSIGVVPREYRNDIISQPMVSREQAQQLSHQQMTPEQIEQLRRMQDQAQNPRQNNPSSGIGRAVINGTVGMVQQGKGILISQMIIWPICGLIGVYLKSFVYFFWNMITHRYERYSNFMDADQKISISSEQDLKNILKSMSGKDQDHVRKLFFQKNGWEGILSFPEAYDKDGNLDVEKTNELILSQKIGIGSDGNPMTLKDNLNSISNIEFTDEDRKEVIQLRKEKENIANTNFPDPKKEKRYQELEQKFIIKNSGISINQVGKNVDNKPLTNNQLKNSNLYSKAAYYGFYVFWAVVVMAVIYFIYKLIRKRSDKKKKQQYAQAHQGTNMQEITIPMLCEWREDYAKYYSEMQPLDEGVMDVFKKIAPTPRNIARIIDKGISLLSGLAKATSAGLEDGSVGVVLGTVSNVLIGIANIVLVTAKGLMLGLSRLFGGGK